MLCRLLQQRSRRLATALAPHVGLRNFIITPILRNDNSRPGLTNILAGDIPPPVQVTSVTREGVHLADGRLLPSACIFLDGKVFLWEVPRGRFEGWEKAHFEIFESVIPRPELLLFGTGRNVMLLPSTLRTYVNELGIQLDIMDTRNACSTYNLLAEEGRRVAAALLPLSHRSWRSE